MNRKGPLKNYIIVKFQNTINKKEMLKASREEKKKGHLQRKGNQSGHQSDFSAIQVEGRRQ